MAVVLTKDQARADYVTRAVVLGRGWTRTALGRFMAEPDATMPDLRYRGSPPIRLYAMKRVSAVEETREWQEWYRASRRRRAASARAGAGVVGEPACGAGGLAQAGAPGASSGERVGVARDAGSGRGRGSNREVA
ncbi:hypothetical protein [Streptomyces sp. SID3343]|uniref:hypothetical protein n=1 Tax=Streptomyces sp. SID3343 TaxID=2690260 RepID=UPI00136CBEAF|nr:hypothetical protein [Streptomyces sp. SID3343]MYW02410.1 hypothetical protein [Streptomyces sp. SID3343]